MTWTMTVVSLVMQFPQTGISGSKSLVFIKVFVVRLFFREVSSNLHLHARVRASLDTVIALISPQERKLYVGTS